MFCGQSLSSSQGNAVALLERLVVGLGLGLGLGLDLVVGKLLCTRICAT